MIISGRCIMMKSSVDASEKSRVAREKALALLSSGRDGSAIGKRFLPELGLGLEIDMLRYCYC